MISKAQTGNFTLELLFGISILAICLFALIREQGMLLRVLGELGSRNKALNGAMLQEELLYGGDAGSDPSNSSAKALASCQQVTQIAPYQALRCGDDAAYRFLVFGEAQ